jgi:hypothetical protein
MQLALRQLRMMIMMMMTVDNVYRLTDDSSHGKVVDGTFSHEDLVYRRLSD